jgi:aspartyl-tRNA(Asn)/glutamyl-tRNA(Gln) amidotransferase subunit B
MRTKEMAHDYRYFPDPDLMPVQVDQEWIERVRQELPEKPFDKQRRYQEEMNLPYSATSALCGDHLLCAYFEEAARLAKSATKTANWVVNDLLRELSQTNKVDEYAEETTDRVTPQSCPVTPEKLAELVNLIEDGKLTNNVAKELFPEMFTTGKSAPELIKEKGLDQKSDDGEIEGICADAIANDPDAADKFRGGKEGAINALKGAVMKATRGQANPKVVDETLRRLLS